MHGLTRLATIGWVLLTLGMVSTAWAVCEYCKEINTSGGTIQLCNGTGTSTCGLYYIHAITTCCSNQPNSLCSETIRTGLTITLLWQNTTGNFCNGAYYCSNTSTPCAGDIMVATSHDCIAIGPIYEQRKEETKCK